MRYPGGSMLAQARARGAIEHVAWDPVARIEVSRIPPPDPDHMTFPALIGRDRAFLERFRLMLTQNNFAFTYAVDYDGDRSPWPGSSRRSTRPPTWRRGAPPRGSWSSAWGAASTS